MSNVRWEHLSRSSTSAVRTTTPRGPKPGDHGLAFSHRCRDARGQPTSTASRSPPTASEPSTPS